MRRLNFCRIVFAAVCLFGGANRVGWTATMERPILSRIPANYPEVARRMRVEGTVVVEVTAMPNGSVTHVHAISGHPLLMQAAEDCVSHWRFMPMSKPEQGTVSVVFSLGE
jgi:TonB family protein